MRPLRDSTDALERPEELAARMREDGYLYVRGLLPKAHVLDVRRQMLEILAANRMVRADRPLGEAVPDFDHFAVEPQPAFMKVLYAEYALEDLTALQHLPEMRRVADAICGEATIPLPQFVCRNIFPQAEAYTTPPHQDFVHIQGTTRNCAAWVPIGDCEPELGGLLVAAGSHRDGLLPFRPSLGAGGLEVTGDFAGRWHGGAFRAGDVLVHNCLTVHRALPNRSGDRMRLSVDFRFQPVSEPICAQNVEPLRNMATWDELYRDWPDDDLKYYWRRHDLRLVPFDWSHYRRRDEMAFAMAEAGDVRARSALQRVAANDPEPARRERAAAALAGLG